MGTVDRALGVLQLFAGERSEWTIEAAARELGLAQSTAYEYFRSLAAGGLLSTYRPGRYVVGPAIIELDRQTRLRDPLIQAAREEMDALSASLTGEDDVVLLCRLYRFTVMCVDQRAPVAPRKAVSYERGRPMPLEKGAASKVILAHLAPRTLRRYYDQTYGESDSPGWAEFRKPLRAIRKAKVSITHADLDPGRAGIATPIFGERGDIVGSISLVLSEDALDNGVIPADVQQRLILAGTHITANLGKAG